MRDLLGRLSELDQGAESLVRVIAYFDTLVDGHVGLETIVRSAAALGGCTAGASDPDRQIFLRVDADGLRLDRDVAPADGSRVVHSANDGLEVWLERPDGPRPTDTMVLERFASSAAIVVERSYGRAPGRDPGQVELLLDSRAPSEVRTRAGRRLGLPAQKTLQVVAVQPPDPETTAATLEQLMPGLEARWSTPLGRLHAFVVPEGAVLPDPAGHLQAGFGPAAQLAGLSDSLRGAVIALRLTAAGTERDPGARQLDYVDLGGLAVIAESYDGQGTATRDIDALERVQAMWPWALTTLEGVANHGSLRQAASRLHLHHSTVQQRAAQLAGELDFDIDTAGGRLRLQLALALRRVANNGPMP